MHRNGLAYRITNRDREGRYRTFKEVITDPHLPVLLLRTSLEEDDQFLRRLRLYTLRAAPGGRRLGNNAHVLPFHLLLNRD